MKKRRKISDQIEEREKSLIERGEKYQGEFLDDADESEDFKEEALKAGKLYRGGLFMGEDIFEDEEDEEGGPGTDHIWELYSEDQKQLEGDLNQRERQRPDKDEEALLVWNLYSELGSYKKVAWKLNLSVTTVKSKFARAFEIETGRPFTRENHRVFKQLQKMAKMAEVSPCLDCSDHDSPKCPCDKLLGLLPDECPQRGYIGNGKEGDARDWRSELELPEGPYGVKSARKPTAE